MKVFTSDYVKAKARGVLCGSEEESHEFIKINWYLFYIPSRGITHDTMRGTLTEVRDYVGYRVHKNRLFSTNEVEL